MRSEYLARKELEHLLAALTYENRLALEISMHTGLRISDVLSIRTEQVQNSKDGRITVREQKTGKYRRIYLTKDFIKRMLRVAGKIYVFEHRLDYRKHRTRQAVNKDLARVASVFRVKAHVSPHTARKTYAVNFYHQCGDIGRVQRILNHDSEAVTMLYAMADELYTRTYKRGE